VDSSDLEPRQKICLIDTLEAVYGEEVQSEEILVLHHSSDFLTSDQTAALHAGSDDGHFGERCLVLERVVVERMTDADCERVQVVECGGRGSYRPASASNVVPGSLSRSLYDPEKRDGN
jgi:hypothetical protein